MYDSFSDGEPMFVTMSIAGCSCSIQSSGCGSTDSTMRSRSRIGSSSSIDRNHAASHSSFGFAPDRSPTERSGDAPRPNSDTISAHSISTATSIAFFQQRTPIAARPRTLRPAVHRLQRREADAARAHRLPERGHPLARRAASPTSRESRCAATARSGRSRARPPRAAGGRAAGGESCTGSSAIFIEYPRRWRVPGEGTCHPRPAMHEGLAALLLVAVLVGVTAATMIAP